MPVGAERRLMNVQWEWLGVLVTTVFLVSLAFSVWFGVALESVLLPFGGMAVIGIVVGWMLRHITRFNPYDYE
jgi:hypothetical protein